jgi:hypothetical protein
MVRSTPAELAAAGKDARTIEIAADVIPRLPAGHSDLVTRGSRWTAAGQLPQGTVYRPLNTVFTVMGRNVHEAYLVIDSQGALAGFYLPGEARFSPVDQKVLISLKAVQ